MPKLPVIKPRDVIAFLEYNGFFLKRSEGSHRRFHHQDGRRTTVAYHTKPLKKGTLRSILRQSELTVEDLLSYLRKH